MATIFISSSAGFSRRLGAAGAALFAAAVLGSSAWSASPRFYPDDPLWTDDDRAFDAAKVEPLEDTNGYDFVVNTFGNPGERRDVRAMNVNTVDEVPDSSWFTNRIGRREMNVAEVVKGPDITERVSMEGWVVSGGKGSGVQPGFRMSDRSGQLYQVEVDPPSNPELATGAETIGTAFYHAIGYHVVEVYLAEIDRDALVISEDATIRDPLNGRRRRLKKYDLDNVFERAARLPNGRYRVLVSRFAPGRPLGNFRYYGTRPDDPNDIVPHEHRRELRGARVFAAWLNHDDSRGINSLDMLETTNGRAWVKHYMFDFGSILGSGTVYAQRHRPGHEYIFEAAPGWLSLVTLGLYVRPWMLIDYPEVPKSIGRFEADAFDPLKWKPEYPNPAFENMRLDDAFWAARIVSRFSDEMIRGVVEKAQYSDPRATEFMTQALIKRRDRVVSAWLNGVCPVVDAALAGDGTLTFANAAISAQAATAPESYQVQWFRFDNAADTKTPAGEAQTVTAMSARAPAGLAGDFVGVTISAKHPSQPGWARPSSFYFRRSGSSWTLVGVERGQVLQ
ncbi:MAG TPA: hypothetical protein VD833_19385 [Vicinamibacterales bacterium]|nr:hypothetical protein [Vicinamibacterales bacterium]